MIEAARPSETTLVNFYQTTRRYNPEDSHFVLTAVRTSNPTQSVILSGNFTVGLENEILPKPRDFPSPNMHYLPQNKKFHRSSHAKL
jgi:hypothetical protein